MTDRKIVKSEHGSVDHPAPQYYSSNVTQMDMAATLCLAVGWALEPCMYVVIVTHT